jgi:hypothetical protein
VKLDDYILCSQQMDAEKSTMQLPIVIILVFRVFQFFVFYYYTSLQKSFNHIVLFLLSICFCSTTEAIVNKFLIIISCFSSIYIMYRVVHKKSIYRYACVQFHVLCNENKQKNHGNLRVHGG